MTTGESERQRNAVVVAQKVLRREPSNDQRNLWNKKISDGDKERQIIQSKSYSRFFVIL